jgi:capsular polysaccharide biosynthesis protein
LHDKPLNGKKRTNSLSTESGPPAPREAPQEEEYGLSIHSIQELLQIIRRRIWVIVLTTVLLVGAVVGYSLIQAPVYEASIKILVGQQRDSDVPPDLGNDIMGLQQLTLTMAEAVGTRPVAEAVTQELNLKESPEDLLEVMNAEQIGNTQFIQITYWDTDPEQAQRIVNTIGKKFSEQSFDVSPTASPVTARVWERAVTPQAPVSPNPLRNGLVALVVGSMLGLGLAFLLEYLDDSWRSPEEVEQTSGVPTFGVIPLFKASKAKKGDY